MKTQTLTNMQNKH